MASPSKTGPPVARPSPDVALPVESVRPYWPSPGVRLLLAFSGLILLVLSKPTASSGSPGLWAPSAGLGLVLVAWFGSWAGLLILGAGLIAVLQTVLIGTVFAGRVDAASISLTAIDALLGTAQALAAWWAYRRLGGGARALNDPQSAVLFVLLVPGLTAVLFAVAHVVLVGVVLEEWTDFPQRLAQWWLSRALGLLAVAPPLLTAATPWLVRLGLIRPETATRKQSADAGHAGAGAPRRRRPGGRRRVGA